jgi:hypothetical protein
MVTSLQKVCKGINSKNNESIIESLQLFRNNKDDYHENQMNEIINDMSLMLNIIEKINYPEKILSNLLEIFEDEDNKVDVFTNSNPFISGLFHVLNTYLKDDGRKSYLINEESMYYTLIIINNLIGDNFFNNISKNELNGLIRNISNRIENEFSYCIQELLLEFLCRISNHFREDVKMITNMYQLLPISLKESFQNKSIGPIKIIRESRKYLNLMNIHNDNIISIQAASCYALVNEELDQITDDKYHQVIKSHETDDLIIINNTAWFTVDKDEIMIEINRDINTRIPLTNILSCLYRFLSIYLSNSLCIYVSNVT